jgi:CheY-like chemotaxis protein
MRFMSYRVLVVDQNLTAATVAKQILVGTGYQVAVVSTFQDATRQLALNCPDLLITAVRLQAFNGLHLLLRWRADHPNLPAIVVGSLDDFTSDIGRYGARFVATPIDRSSLLTLVSDLLAGSTPHYPSGKREWLRKRAELPAIVLETSARVVELGYGGLRLEMPESREEIHGPIDVRFPTLGLSVTAVPRWSKPCEDKGSWWYGAEIADAGSDATRTWRRIVHSLN